MLQKFKKINNKVLFYRVLGTKTGRDPGTIQNHWFSQKFCTVPVHHQENAEKTIDTFIEYENELSKITESLKLKYFGK